MPPPGSPQPAQDEIDGLVAMLERSIDSRPAAPAGYVTAQRLEPHRVRERREGSARRRNRPDRVPAGRDRGRRIHEHCGGAQRVAGIRRAIRQRREHGRPSRRRRAQTESRDRVLPAARRRISKRYVDGLPLGTRGGMRFKHTFPADGEYRLTVTNLGVGLYPRALETQHTLVVLVDRNEAFRADIGGAEDLGAHGSRRRAGACRDHESLRQHPAASQSRHARGRRHLHRALARRERRADLDVHAERELQLHGRRARSGHHRRHRHDRSVRTRRACRARRAARSCSSASPRSPIASGLRRADRDRSRAARVPAAGRPGRSRPPDAVLRRRAQRTRRLRRGHRAHGDRGAGEPGLSVSRHRSARGRERRPLRAQRFRVRLAALLLLMEPGSRRRAARGSPPRETSRIRDPRRASEAHARRPARRGARQQSSRSVGSTWTISRRCSPTSCSFRSSRTVCARTSPKEIKLFLGSVLLEDQNVQTLLTADYTFLNERLARHYGVASVVGPQFRRVALDDKARHGLLGKGAVLLRTSYGDRTSPVLRGAWVLDKLMGTPPTPPPPGVETNLSNAPGRAAENGARAPRAASRELHVQGLPRRDRSVRPRAREFHGDGRAGATTTRRPARRSTRAPSCRAASRSTGPSSSRGAARPPRSIRAGDDARSS